MDTTAVTRTRKIARFRWSNWVAIAAGFTLLVLAALCAIAVAISENQISHASRQSRQVRDLQASVFKAIEDAETSQRGYLLTNDPGYLQPFEFARARLPGLEAKLGPAASVDGRQAKRLSTIRFLVDSKLDELSHTVELHRAGHGDEALAIVKSNLGRDIMARIRAESGVFDREEATSAPHARSPAMRVQFSLAIPVGGRERATGQPGLRALRFPVAELHRPGGGERLNLSGPGRCWPRLSTAVAKAD